MTSKTLKRKIEKIRQLERGAAAALHRDLRAERAKIVKRRKADAHRKIQLGAAVIKAGLGNVPYPELVELLIKAKAILDWQNEGRAKQQFAPEVEIDIKIDAEVDDDPVCGLCVRFNRAPGSEVTQLLKSRGFKYSSADRTWTGRGRERELRTELEGACAGAIGFKLDRSD